MSQPLRVEIRVNATGRGKLIVNGVDMSNRVQEARYETIACRYAKITLVLHADELTADGEAFVTVEQATPDDTQEAAAVRKPPCQAKRVPVVSAKGAKRCTKHGHGTI